MALPAIQERISAEHAPAAAQLASAFEMFNELSAQLSDTYREMEQRVVQLDGELHRVAEQRLQELQEKERVASRLQSLLTLLPAGVIVLDQFGRIADSNPAASRPSENAPTTVAWSAPVTCINGWIMKPNA